MERKHDVNNINLAIENIDFWSANEFCKGGMRIYWSSDIGFGQLDIIKHAGNDGEDFESPYEELKLLSCTECMDSDDDKTFTRKIMSLLVDKLNILD